MLKKIWMPFLALAVFGCSNDNDVISSDENMVVNFQNDNFSPHSTKRGGTSLAVNNYAYSHLLIIKEMQEIINYEVENGLEFDVDTKDLENLDSDTATFDFLTNNYMNAGNAKDLIDLYKTDMENYQNLLQYDNDFAGLSIEEQQVTLLNAIQEIKISNPEEFPPQDHTEIENKANNCQRIKWNQIDNCTDDFGTTLIGSILLAPVTGGWGTAVGFGIGMYNVIQCEKRAQRDYKLCMKG